MKCDSSTLFTLNESQEVAGKEEARGEAGKRAAMAKEKSQRTGCSMARVM